MPEMKQDRLAFDRASIRSVDPTSGHLHVSSTPISKANICPYNGSEIPQSKELGLDSNRVYMLLRDPEELEKSAPTFENKPLLIVHRPQQADDHSHDIVVGSISGVTWQAPYLMASLAVWTDEAIAAVESGDQRELSSGYAYDADMTPGEYQGEKYDGVMRNIRGNHVALVTEGRVGPDVFIGDVQIQPPKKEPAIMAKVALSRKALLASGALRGYMQPKLAADAAPIDFGLILKGVTAKNWKSSKPKIKTALDAAVKGKLATDADLGDIVEMLDQLDDVVDEVADTTEAPLPASVSGDDDLDDNSAMDGPGMGKVMDFLKGKLSEADMATVSGMCKADPAAPANDAELPEAGKPVQMTKAAMDATLKAAAATAAATAKRETIAHMNAISEAIRVVRPHVGEIVTAMDSAAHVYKFALDAAKVDLTDVPEAAYPALVRMLPLPGTAPVRQPRQAMDAAAAEGYAKRFPNANRLVR